VQENFRGRQESIKLLMRFGFDQKFSLVYLKPWINRSQTLGLGIGLGYSRNHTVAYRTEENKLLYYKSKESYPNQNYYAGIKLTYRKGLYSTHTLAAYYDHYTFSDTLLKLNPSFAPFTKTQYFSLSYKFENDKRDYKTYPLSGHYLSFELEKKGLGLLPDEVTDLFTLKISARKYWPVYPRYFLSCAFFGRVAKGDASSYFTEQGLGYGSETVRSFEYYVVDGLNYALVKTQFKYQLMKTKILHLKFLHLSKFNTIPLSFYINLFYDGGFITKYPVSSTDKLANRYLYGGGMGIDFVTYYDQVIRLDYAVNMFFEHGIFLHFTSPF
jgi:outer membrane protein assembly factor BamA